MPIAGIEPPTLSKTVYTVGGSVPPRVGGSIPAPCLLHFHHHHHLMDWKTYLCIFLRGAQKMFVNLAKQDPGRARQSS